MRIAAGLVCLSLVVVSTPVVSTPPAAAPVRTHRPLPAQAGPGSPVTGTFPFIRGPVDDESARDGAWLNWETKLTPWPSKLRGKEAWRPLFEALSDFIRQSPALTTMREYYPWLSYGVDADVAPLPRAQISLVLWPSRWVEPAPGTLDGIRLKSGAGGFTPAGLDLWINWFPTSASGSSDDLASPEWYRDADGAFFRLSRPDRLIDGFPVHGGWLFVTAKDKPPLFTPVSQERLLRAYIAAAERLMTQVDTVNADLAEALAEFNSADMKALRRQAIEQAAAGETDPARAAALRARAARDDAEQERQLRDGAGATASSNPASAAARAARDRWAQRLEAMSEAERRRAAHARDDPETLLLEDLATPTDPAAVAVMQYNPAFVNTALGRHVPQLLVLPIGSSHDAQRRPEVLARLPVLERVPIAVVEQSRWSELQRLLR
ncbi:MAG: hypothetical protein KA371_00730 [Acidobacteria bacterium]|nr:hypothetical protein [Acidobacteriota bacterium]